MTRTRPFVLSARVDYDADGHVDTAYLVQNRRQHGVMVEHGGPRRRAPTLAMRFVGPIGGGTQLRAIGRHRLELNEPDAAPVILLLHRGKPSMIFTGD